jgi:hypothetical protein
MSEKADVTGKEWKKKGCRRFGNEQRTVWCHGDAGGGARVLSGRGVGLHGELIELDG